MLPTFEVYKDGVLVSRWFRRGRGVEVGDVVTFDSVGEPGEKVIKRVIGLEGDYVMRDTPGSKSQKMLQVNKGFYFRKACANLNRFRPVIAGWLGTICLHRGIRGCLGPCQWP